MRRREFMGLGAAAPAALSFQARGRRPNIVLVVADNLGYGVLGCYGQTQIQTPNLDRMAAEGIRFTQAYVGGIVCAPSRCTLMTGLHTGHARVRGNTIPAAALTPQQAQAARRGWRPEAALRPEDVTVAEVLKQAGYRTGVFGKWGLGGAGSTGTPNDQGFDEWFGYLDQLHAHDFYPSHLWHNRKEVFLRGNMGTSRSQYSHDLFTQYALEFVERHKDEPFFLYLPYVLPALDNELFRDTKKGVAVPEYGPYADKDWPEFAKGFAAMIWRIDRDMGRLMAQLKRLNLDENTLVIFTSDNGPLREAGHDPSFFQDQGPFRGNIRDMYEGGLRVPAIARWPGVVKPGAVSDFAWALWDILPTLAAAAEVPAPEGLDGISILPTLTGKPQRGHDYLYWEFHERGFSQACRMGVWKGVRLGSRSAPLELYNLRDDPGERRNVAEEHRDIAAELAALLDTARTDSPLFPIQEASACRPGDNAVHA